MRRYADRLGKVKAGSANVTFKRVADIELPVVEELVARARDLMLSGTAGVTGAALEEVTGT